MADLAHISGERLAIIEGLFPEDTHEMLREIAISMYLALIEDAELQEALSFERLANIALDLTDRISLDHGGTQFYLPRGMSRRINDRNRRIWAEFNGRNRRELARKYDLSEMRLDQIFKAFRQKMKRDSEDWS